MVYKWARNFNYKVPAQVVGEEIQKIEEKNGSVTPSAIVEKARAKNNPMHQMFEWDDKKAAELQRRQTARQIMGNLTVIVEDAEPVRAYVNIEKQGGHTKGIFMNIQEAMTNAESRENILINAKNELLAFKRKYGRLTEFAKLIPIIDELTEGEDE